MSYIKVGSMLLRRINTVLVSKDYKKLLTAMRREVGPLLRLQKSAYLLRGSKARATGEFGAIRGPEGVCRGGGVRQSGNLYRPAVAISDQRPPTTGLSVEDDAGFVADGSAAAVLREHAVAVSPTGQNAILEDRFIRAEPRNQLEGALRLLPPEKLE